MVLLDDLHWADPASLDLLRFVAREIAVIPLLLIVTYRADELTRRHPLYQLLPVLEREAHATRLDLRRLSADAIQALVAQYHLPEADQERLLTHLQARAEGNAFFVIQLLRALEESGALQPNDRNRNQGWTLGNLVSVQVPVPLKQVIDGRLTRLGEETQRLLAMAAVIGQDVPLTIWATVAGADEETLLGVIEQGTAVHLIEETPDGMQARFVHALIRETLYESILPSRRRRIHRQVGETLSALANPDPDAIAYHFRQAGDARAAKWLIAAGERAERAYAFITAAERFEAALRVMDEHGVRTREQGQVLRWLARSLRFADPWKGIRYLDEVVLLAAELGDHALTASALNSRGALHFLTGTCEQGLADMEAAVAMLTDPAAIADNHREIASYLTWIGRYAQAQEVWDRLVPEERDYDLLSARHPELYTPQVDAVIRTAMGQPEEARRAFSRSRATMRAARRHYPHAVAIIEELYSLFLPYYADQVQERHDLAAMAEESYIRVRDVHADPRTRLIYLPLLVIEGAWHEARQLADIFMEQRPISWHRHIIGAIGALAYAQGDDGLLRRLMNLCLPAGLATPLDATWFTPTLALQRFVAAHAIDNGDSEAAHAWIEAYHQRLEWSGAILGQSEGQALWAAYHRATGDSVAAYASTTRALQHATEPRQPLALLTAHRLLGELDTAAGRHDDAEKHLDAALALADACAAPYERALTLLAMAECHTARGETADAIALLDAARAICTPLGAKPALARADALLTRLAAIKDSPSAHPAGLSAREVEVLRLIVAGQTNRGIADALFLSEHTVRVHVRNILTKTDTANRTEAAAFALRHDLA